MNIDQTLRNFKTLLEAGLPIMCATIDNERFTTLRADWMQANWEILVEATLIAESGHFLDVYGDGADCNGDSSRVWQPLAIPTHRICCSPIRDSFINVLNSQSITSHDMPFDRFVSWDGVKYDEIPPFDFVMLQDNHDQLIVSLSEVTFSLKRIS